MTTPRPEVLPAQSLSLIGTWVQTVAQALLVLRGQRGQQQRVALGLEMLNEDQKNGCVLTSVPGGMVSANRPPQRVRPEFCMPTQRRVGSRHGDIFATLFDR